MSRAPLLTTLVVLIATIICFSLAPPARLPAPPLPPGPPAAGPNLLVLLVFDQLRGDYLTRWHDLFGPDGFRRLTGEGAWFTNCHYPYATTVTGPGHATLGTGCTPDRHGIIANDWFDRASGGTAYCATVGDRYKILPLPKKGKPGAGGS